MKTFDEWVSSITEVIPAPRGIAEAMRYGFNAAFEQHKIETQQLKLNNDLCNKTIVELQNELKESKDQLQFKDIQIKNLNEFLETPTQINSSQLIHTIVRDGELVASIYATNSDLQITCMPGYTVI